MTDSVMFAPQMFFRERYELRGGAESAFVDRYLNAYSPGLARLGMRRVALWKDAFVQGRAREYLALWEFEQPQQLMRLSVALDSLTDGDADLQQARDALAELVLRREGWTLLGYPPIDKLADRSSAGASLRCCVYQEVDLVPNQYELFNKAVRVNFMRLLKGSDIRLVGVFRPQLLSVDAVVLWDLPNGCESLSFLDRIDATPEWHHWNSIAQTVRTGWRARVLTQVG